MNDLLQIFALLLIAYVSLGSLIAYFSRRYGVKSSKDYFVSGYKLGWFLASMTYAATTYSAFMMVGLVGLTYSSGVGALGFELAYLLVTVILLAVLGPAVWAMARERKWVSPSEMLSDLYESKLVGYATVTIYLVAMIPYVAAQIVGVAAMFESLGVGYEAGILVMSFLTLAWVVLAGMWSVATTDAYQGLWMLSAAILLVSLLLSQVIPSSGVTLNQVLEVLSERGLLGITEFWTPQTFLAYTIPWIFFAATNPQVVVRLYVHKDMHSFKKSVLLFSVFGFLYTIAVVCVGLLTRGLTELGLFEVVSRSDLVTPTLVSRLHPVLASFIYISILAAAVSTANSIILTVASSFVRDLIERRGVSSVNVLKLSNTIVALLTIASAYLAYTRLGFVVDLSVLTSVLLLPLAPVTIAAWLAPHKSKYGAPKKAALLSLLVGTLTAFISALTLGPRKTFLTSYYGLPISAIILIMTSIIVFVGYTIPELKTRLK
ncbi:MAG: sodium:solute symporter family protein [Zestosphaera sp.]